MQIVYDFLQQNTVLGVCLTLQDIYNVTKDFYKKKKVVSFEYFILQRILKQKFFLLMNSK